MNKKDYEKGIAVNYYEIKVLGVLGLQVSEETIHSNTEEEAPFQGMEPYLVRRLSCRNVQLPPLAFRQLEQADWDRRSDMETTPRPTSLPLRIPPLIAITSAESSRSVLP